MKEKADGKCITKKVKDLEVIKYYAIVMVVRKRALLLSMTKLKI